MSDAGQGQTDEQRKQWLELVQSVLGPDRLPPYEQLSPDYTPELHEALTVPFNPAKRYKEPEPESPKLSDEFAEILNSLMDSVGKLADEVADPSPILMSEPALTPVAEPKEKPPILYSEPAFRPFPEDLVGFAKDHSEDVDRPIPLAGAPDYPDDRGTHGIFPMADLPAAPLGDDGMGFPESLTNPAARAETPNGDEQTRLIDTLQELAEQVGELVGVLQTESETKASSGNDQRQYMPPRQESPPESRPLYEQIISGLLSRIGA